MTKIEEQELLTIIGGFSLTGAVVNAVLSVGKFIYETGRGLGNALRRIGSNNLCPLN